MFQWRVGMILCLIIASASVWIGTVLAQPPTRNPNPFVYRLKISGCKYEPLSRRQTGFRVQGRRGIVTALHGVADCTKISAITDETGERIFNDLYPVEVDIGRDLVLLSSDELRSEPDTGIRPLESDLTDEQYKDLEIIGYPLGVSKQDWIPHAFVSEERILADLIPDDFKEGLRSRGSPDLSIKILSVKGAHLVPGHSGAPLLTPVGELLGVGNGGLAGGSVEIAWVIPWNEIEWIAVDEHSDSPYSNLKAKDPNRALAFSSTFSGSISDVPEPFTYYGRIIDANTHTTIEGVELTLLFREDYAVSSSNPTGIFSFTLGSELLGESARVVAEHSDYQLLEQEVVIKRSWEEILLNEAVSLRVPDVSTLAPPTARDDRLWESPPNNDYGNATGPLESGVVYLGYPEDEVDFYGFDLLQEGPVSIRLENYRGGEGELALYYQSTTDRVARDPNGKESFIIERRLERLGRYYIAVFTKSRFTDVEPYRLRVDYPGLPPGTHTSTPTATAGPSHTPTATPTSTSSATLTATHAPTDTVTATSTSTGTPHPTDTATATSTSTQTPTVTETPQPTWTSTSTSTDTPTLTSTFTGTPTEEPTLNPTDTVSSEPTVKNTSVVLGVNIRTGPSRSYGITEVLFPGGSLHVIGRYDAREPNNNFTWWQVELPDGRKGWVRRDVVTISGDIARVPVVTNIPPTSTPTATLASFTPTPVPAAPTNTPTVTAIATLPTVPTPTPSDTGNGSGGAIDPGTKPPTVDPGTKPPTVAPGTKPPPVSPED